MTHKFFAPSNTWLGVHLRDQYFTIINISTVYKYCTKSKQTVQMETEMWLKSYMVHSKNVVITSDFIESEFQ